eukprot:TRINITY_DN12321_c0_g1_i1.p1 TRINITY_DN12321_c0_g1~~TRINITY_DN12321_c0_g1_i1.p1  ORF type:complete len:84 (-),score=15.81 TRINITY_DN12321_c0_g1_i1:48-299(-)
MSEKSKPILPIERLATMLNSQVKVYGKRSSLWKGTLVGFDEGYLNLILNNFEYFDSRTDENPMDYGKSCLVSSEQINLICADD